MRILYDLAIHLVGTPYKYGGGSPAEGLDCSEFVQILLNAGGADLPGDQTAQGLFDHFAKPANHISQEPEFGSLAFYGKDFRRISHVAFCLDRRRMIEAAGGDSTTVTREEAFRRKACVRIVPIRFEQLIQFALPEYPLAMPRL